MPCHGETSQETAPAGFCRGDREEPQSGGAQRWRRKPGEWRHAVGRAQVTTQTRLAPHAAPLHRLSPAGSLGSSLTHARNSFSPKPGPALVPTLPTLSGVLVGWLVESGGTAVLGQTLSQITLAPCAFPPKALSIRKPSQTTFCSQPRYVCTRVLPLLGQLLAHLSPTLHPVPLTSLPKE